MFSLTLRRSTPLAKASVASAPNDDVVLRSVDSSAPTTSRSAPGTTDELPTPATDDESARADEARWIAQARRGDHAAWTALYQAHQLRLVRHLTYMVGDVDVSRELAQETFAQALNALPRYAEKSSFLTWLCAIANNLARKHWRSQSRRAHAYETLQHVPAPRAPTGDPEAHHLGRRRADALWSVLETLPESLREAFVLVDLQELPVAKAAAQLGISPESLAMRCSRARAKIREALRERGWLNPSDGRST